MKPVPSPSAKKGYLSITKYPFVHLYSFYHKKMSKLCELALCHIDKRRESVRITDRHLGEHLAVNVDLREL